jgi:AcrR family transcriptional regulator
LYFHFRNKEEIIFELFEMMCQETYDVWKPGSSGQQRLLSSPSDLIERSYEVFWKYRFFHREMYHLRRKDPNLAKRWKTHISKTMRLLQTIYAQWVKDGVMHKIEDPQEMQMISDTVLITSSSFLQFFESPAKPATKKSVRAGLEHLLLFLLPYHSEAHQMKIRKRLVEIRPTSG